MSRLTLIALILALLSGTARGVDWPQFDFDDRHSGTSNQETTIHAGNVATLHVRYHVALPGVADGASAFLANVATPTGTKDLLFLTTKNGWILACDAATGAVAWSHQPATGPNYTTSSPAIDPNRQFVYSYGLEGKVHKYLVGDGTEILTGGWPQVATLKPSVEKGSSALTVSTTRSANTDVVWRNYTTGENAIWYMNGTTLIGGGAFNSAPTNWSIVGVGDFNGDGRPDIVWRNYATGENAIWFMNAAAVVGWMSFSPAPLQWSIVGVGDFNGDGRADIVWRNTTTGENAIWYMNGTTVTGGGAFSSAPTAWSIAGVGDFNGDGKPDIVWRNTVTGENAIWYMNVRSVIGGGAFSSAPTAWSIVGSGSLSADGTPYLYATNGGYPGDAGDYQGHVTTVNLTTGAQRVYNANCSDQTVHFTLGGSPDCADVQTAIWAREGVVYDAGHDGILMSTGNGNFDANTGGHNWGDTVFLLHADGSGVGNGPVDSYTPTEFQQLQNADADLGSTAPALLPPVPGSSVRHLAVQSGKDAKIRLLNIDDLSGSGGPGHVGGELQKLSLPQGGEVLTAPAVWQNPIDGGIWVFIANGSGISGLELSVGGGGAPSLVSRWTKVNGGTSPIVVNGILYYASFSGMRALDPATGGPLWSDASISGIHWESPIVVAGRLYITDEGGNLWAYEPNLTP